MLVGLLLASHLAMAPCAHHVKRKHHPACATKAAKDPTLLEEKALRRRAIRLVRIAYFERRTAQLEEFIARAKTETPEFDDERVIRLDGIDIGPTTVTRDFLGSPVLRARVRNAGATAGAILLTAYIRARDGSTNEASIAIEKLDAAQWRDVELTYPGELAPASIEWGGNAALNS